MAKQTGLHLIKGKVGEYSYYRSAGVSAPLMRRINQGLSARVKNGEEYANTRLNNAEFKNAQALATFLFNAVPSRKASMMRRFAIAQMTKKGLEYIKDGSGNWGARIPVATMDGIAVDLLENRAKSGPYQGEFGLLNFAIATGTNTYSLELSMSETNVTDLTSKGIEGFYALVVRGALAEVVGPDGSVRQHFGVSSVSPNDITVSEADETLADFVPSPQTLGMSPAGYTAAQSAANNGMYAIVSFVPYRSIGSGRHVLYEYATYACINLGAIPE